MIKEKKVRGDLNDYNKSTGQSMDMFFPIQYRMYDVHIGMKSSTISNRLRVYPLACRSVKLLSKSNQMSFWIRRSHK